MRRLLLCGMGDGPECYANPAIEINIYYDKNSRPDISQMTCQIKSEKTTDYTSDTLTTSQKSTEHDYKTIFKFPDTEVTDKFYKKYLNGLYDDYFGEFENTSEKISEDFHPDDGDGFYATNINIYPSQDLYNISINKITQIASDCRTSAENLYNIFGFKNYKYKGEIQSDPLYADELSGNFYLPFFTFQYTSTQSTLMQCLQNKLTGNITYNGIIEGDTSPIPLKFYSLDKSWSVKSNDSWITFNVNGKYNLDKYTHDAITPEVGLSVETIVYVNFTYNGSRERTGSITVTDNSNNEQWKISFYQEYDNSGGDSGSSGYSYEGAEIYSIMLDYTFTVSQYHLTFKGNRAGDNTYNLDNYIVNWKNTGGKSYSLFIDREWFRYIQLSNGSLTITICVQGSDTDESFTITSSDVDAVLNGKSDTSGTYYRIQSGY